MAFSKLHDLCNRNKIPDVLSFRSNSEKLYRGAEKFSTFPCDIDDDLLYYVTAVHPNTMVRFILEHTEYLPLCRDAQLKSHWEKAMGKLVFADHPDQPIVVPQEGVNSFDLFAGAAIYLLSLNEKNELPIETAAQFDYFPALLAKYRRSSFLEVPIDSEASFYDTTGLSMARHAEAAKFVWALHFLWIAHALSKTDKTETVAPIALQGLMLLTRLFHHDIDYTNPALHNASFGLGRAGLFRMLFDDKRSNWKDVQTYLCDQATLFEIQKETVTELFLRQSLR